LRHARIGLVSFSFPPPFLLSLRTSPLLTVPPFPRPPFSLGPVFPSPRITIRLQEGALSPYRESVLRVRGKGFFPFSHFFSNAPFPFSNGVFSERCCSTWADLKGNFRSQTHSRKPFERKSPLNISSSPLPFFFLLLWPFAFFPFSRASPFLRVFYLKFQRRTERYPVSLSVEPPPLSLLF